MVQRQKHTNYCTISVALISFLLLLVCHQMISVIQCPWNAGWLIAECDHNESFLSRLCTATSYSRGGIRRQAKNHLLFNKNMVDQEIAYDNYREMVNDIRLVEEENGLFPGTEDVLFSLCPEIRCENTCPGFRKRDWRNCPTCSCA